MKDKFDLRNLGFVSCQWVLRGSLINNNAKLFADGNTFDGKLYTFKETDYKKAYSYLNIFVKKNSELPDKKGAPTEEAKLGC